MHNNNRSIAILQMGNAPPGFITIFALIPALPIHKMEKWGCGTLNPIMDDQTFEKQILAITQEFVQNLPEKAGAMESAWTQVWREGWTSPAVEQLARIAHSLTGAAGSLGFRKIEQASRSLQAALQEIQHHQPDGQDEALLGQVESLVQALRRAIYRDRQIDLRELIHSMGTLKAAATSLREKRANRLIYMVEDDPIQAAELAAQVGYFGYTVQIFHSLEEVEGAIHQAAPTGILMDISFPEGSMAGLEAVGALRDALPAAPPVIFVSVNDAMPFRLQAVRVGGAAYFTKPVEIDALIEVLDRLTIEESPAPYRILIVDDSRVQARYNARQLKNAGMVVEVAADPLQVIDQMISFNPDLLLLDMYMPGCTGTELASVIRQMEQFISVPIVFLSAETDKGRQLTALGLGGDDFLTKPIEPEHLISAVTTRVARYRKLRALMVQDGLTGLLNHSHTRERLAQEVERARRQKLPLSFAMLDLDHFKAVNDSFGHATGDRVLKSLAHLLKQRLRSSDTIGRYGGEEFAVILPNTDELTAARLMTDLCEGFARIHHYAGDKGFTVTFSCGIAAFPDCETAEALALLSDNALYAAKAAGRNQVKRSSQVGGELSASPHRLVYPGRPSYPEAQRAQADLPATIERLSGLNRITQAIVSQLDLEAIVKVVTSEVVSLFKARNCGIALLTEDRTSLRLVGDHLGDAQESGLPGDLFLLADRPATLQALETGQAVYLPNALARPGARPPAGVVPPGSPAPRQVGRLIAPLLAHGKTIGAMHIDFDDPHQVVDPSDLKLAETIASTLAGVLENARLFEAEQRLRLYFEALVQHIPAAVVMVDLQARIRSWNPAAEKLFGYTAAEAIGESTDDLLASDEYRQEALQFTLDTTSEGRLIHSFTRRRRKDGSQADVELLAVPVFVGQKQIGSMAIYHDISELQAARRQAEAANQAKSAFLATMSHEIRTPLNAVVGMTTLLLDTPLTREQQGFTETIRSSSDALLGIINDILDFSKIEAGGIELEEQPFDLRECLESALDLVASRAAEQGLDLAYLLDPHVPPVIIGDSTRLRQVLLNLLSNALKFTSEGEVVVSVSSEQAGPEEGQRVRLHFAVRDTGLGIPAERMDRLFRSFSQVDASTTRKYGGTGLGLAISRRLAELMGGKMWVESAGIPGQGSTFHFTILADPSTSALPVFLHRKQPELHGKRVLIVDDNATNRYILVRQVQSWGMLPQETAFPLQALQWMREGQSFDLVLLDMQMPEMDGAALAAEIQRLLPPESPTVMIMLTSLGLKEVETAGVQFAASLTKPIKPAALYATLLEVFGGRAAFPSPSKGRPPVSASATGAAPLRILLAEDNAINQQVALHLLARLGYRAEAVGNGLEVLEALRRQPYDVILMDVQMPEMDGLETARRVRSGEWLEAGMGSSLAAQPVILAMTANAMQGDRERCLEAGMDDYLSKPIRLDELARLLSQVHPLRLAPANPSAAQGAEASPPQPVIDELTYRRFHLSLEGDEPGVMASLIQDYLGETPQLLAELEQAALQGSLEKSRRLSHSLKSSSLLFGALRLAELCSEVEQNARRGSLEGASGLIAQAQAEFGRVQAALAEKLG